MVNLLICVIGDYCLGFSVEGLVEKEKLNRIRNLYNHLLILSSVPSAICVIRVVRLSVSI